MPTTLETAVAQYLRSGNPAQRTREGYCTTLRKWERWGGGLPLEQLGRKEFREFLDWVHEYAASRVIAASITRLLISPLLEICDARATMRSR